MKTASGKVVKQGAQRLRVRGTNAQDSYLICDCDVATILASAGTGAIVRAVGIVFPAAAIGV